MRETQVRSRDWEDPLEKEMATHSSALAWKIPWMEELGSHSPWNHKESDMIERLHWFIFTREMRFQQHILALTPAVSGGFFPFPSPQLGLIWAHCLPGWHVVGQGRCAVKS